ncbi:MAG: class I SAM-dependent methyltransferase [Bacteroidetes bacterium]|nr:class I SAM-dependent methyltransferase [Bacteroidota bacterium]
MKKIQTAERVSQKDLSDNFVFQRSLLAYIEAAKIVSGNVLEIGTGSGYGIEYISRSCEKLTTVDKYETDIKIPENVQFIKLNVPPLTNIPDNTYDYVITFQVIEHIQKDDVFVKEAYRVLKNGGKLIVTTPNKKMSLTRNPWHIREYTISKLKQLLFNHFQSIDEFGVFGNQKIMDYYALNKQSVKKFTRFDIFNLQYILPRRLLQIPYDIANRMNRKKILEENTFLVSNIKVDDYFLEKPTDECLDLFFIAQKMSSR